HLKRLGAGDITVSQSGTECCHQGKPHQILVFDDERSLQGSISDQSRTPPPRIVFELVLALHERGGCYPHFAKIGRRTPPIIQTWLLTVRFGNSGLSRG